MKRPICGCGCKETFIYAEEFGHYYWYCSSLKGGCGYQLIVTTEADDEALALWQAAKDYRRQQEEFCMPCPTEPTSEATANKEEPAAKTARKTQPEAPTKEVQQLTLF